MIFATVGTQLPFPRLIDALNTLAPSLDEPVIAQVGVSEGHWPALDARPNLTPAAYQETFAAARVVVAHAGLGTILSAKSLGKPLVLLPRRHALGEHRNDHQLATARQVADLPGMHVAWETEDLAGLLGTPELAPATQAPSASHAALLARLSSFIDG
jgi:UDP-N-acetylglucosamine transferase subunit ALG13